METERQASCTAFFDSRRIAGGSFQDVERQIAERVEPAQRASVLIFNDQNGKRIEHGEDSPPPDIPAAPRGPGRPRLGVVAREITLLPRHWAWLNAQPGGASVALRRLIEESRRQGGSLDRKRRARDSGSSLGLGATSREPTLLDGCRFPDSCGRAARGRRRPGRAPWGGDRLGR